jgi:predicted transcriptional regulator
MCGPPEVAPPFGSPAHDLQRQLLLELVTSPPPRGDELDQLARALAVSRREAEAAVQDLVDAGLAERDGDTVRASIAATRFEALWPIHA